MSVVSAFIRVNSGVINTAAAPAVGFKSFGSIKAVQALTRVSKPRSVASRPNQKVFDSRIGSFNRAGRISKRDVKY